MDRPSEEYLQKLSRIVDAAAQVFQDKGYGEASLDEIAEGLQLRKTSLYHYVGSKAELLRMVFEHTLTLALERFQAIQTIPDAGARLRALIEHQVYTIISNPTYYAVFFEQRVYLNERQRAQLREKELEYFRVYQKAVEDTVAAGIIPPVDPYFGAQALLGMTSWAYKWFQPSWHDPDEFAETCVRLIMHSFAEQHNGEPG